MAVNNLRQFSISGSALASHLQMGEVLSGSTDGVNKVFTTSLAIYGSSVDIYVGSQGGFSLMKNNTDYTISLGDTITMTVAPPPGSIVLADYINP